MMQDKLIKNGHKKPFYRAMTAAKVFAFALVLSLASALPVIAVAHDSVKDIEIKRTIEVPEELEDNVDGLEIEEANAAEENESK